MICCFFVWESHLGQNVLRGCEYALFRYSFNPLAGPFQYFATNEPFPQPVPRSCEPFRPGVGDGRGRQKGPRGIVRAAPSSSAASRKLEERGMGQTLHDFRPNCCRVFRRSSLPRLSRAEVKRPLHHYRARGQDGPQEMERNEAAARNSWAR